MSAHPTYEVFADGHRTPFRPRRRIHQPGQAELLVAPDPLADRGPADTGFGSDVGDRAPVHDDSLHEATTAFGSERRTRVNRQVSSLVGVDSVTRAVVT